MSEGELSKKLRDKGFSDTDTAEAVSWFSEHGFVDDEAYTDELVRYYTSRGCGKRRIKEELYRRGISRELVERALETLPDFTDEIRALIEKKLRGEELTPERKQKITAFLIRRGFGYDEIRAAFETEDFY
jgi:regulatory protein